MEKKRGRKTKQIDDFDGQSGGYIRRNIRMIIEQLFNSEKEFAELMGWSSPKLSKILNHQQDLIIEDVLKMAEILNLEVDVLLNKDLQVKDIVLKTVYSASECWKYIIGRQIDSSAEEWFIQSELPKALKRELGINDSEFIVEGIIERVKSFVITVDDTEIYEPLYQIVIKSCFFHKKNGLQIRLELPVDKKYLKLAIIDVPEGDIVGGESDENRWKFFKNMLKGLASKDELSANDKFGQRRILGEIVTKTYYFDYLLKDMDVVVDDIVNDIERFLNMYKLLLKEFTSNSEIVYWKMYNILIDKTSKQSLVPDEVLKELGDMFSDNNKEINFEEKEDAIAQAGNECEICHIDKTFEDSNGTQYFEVVPFIPQLFATSFSMNVNTPANLLCLCPMCKSKLYHASREEKEEMLVQLFYARKQALAEEKVPITLVKLLKMYGCD